MSFKNAVCVWRAALSAVVLILSTFTASAQVTLQTTTLYNWGENANFSVSKLGDPFYAGTPTIASIKQNTYAYDKGLTRIIGMSSGAMHTLTLNADGTVWAAGSNTYGQLGTGLNTPSSTSFTQVPGLTGIIAVAAGGVTAPLPNGVTNQAHSLALKKDGTVWAWGYNAYGQVGNNSTANCWSPVQVLMTSNGRIKPLTSITAIAAGNSHSVALDSNGVVYTWGNNDSCQLGNGQTPDFCPSSTVAAAISFGSAKPVITSISTLNSHCLAVASTGSLYGWGLGSYGSLSQGPNDVGNKPSPVLIRTATGTLAGVTAAGAGCNHSVALLSNGQMWAWGYAYNGQLGCGQVFTGQENTNPYLTYPTQVGVQNAAAPTPPSSSYPFTSANIKSFSVGYTHNLALDDTGTVWAWGDNEYWETGSGQGAGGSVYYPQPIFGLQDNITYISAGFNNSRVLSGNPDFMLSTSVVGGGAIMQPTYSPYSVTKNVPIGIQAGWYNGNRFLRWTAGLNAFVSMPNSPTTTATLSGDETVTAFMAHENNDLWATGQNGNGQLGNGSTTNAVSYVTVKSNPNDPVPNMNYKGTAFGAFHSLAVKESSNDGVERVYAWGDNSVGQLGGGYVGGQANYPQMVVFTMPSYSLIAGGSYHSLAVKNNAAVSFGYNNNGQLGNNDSSHSDRKIPVNVFGSITPTMMSGSKCYDEANWKNSTGVSTLYSHSAALVGTSAVTWGANQYGQLGNGKTTSSDIPVTITLPGTPTPSVVAVAAGGCHTLALTQDGNVYAWGHNACGQLGNGTTVNSSTPVQVRYTSSTYLDGIVQIAAGAFHSLALDRAGYVYAWGWNQFGQLGDGTYNNRVYPVYTDMSNSVQKIAAGSAHSFAITSASRVYSWGYNNYGQLGDGTVTTRNYPMQITTSSLSSVSSIEGGMYHSVALISGGTVKTWGCNISGQLGNGSTSGQPFPTPTQINISGISAVAAGGYHSIILNSGGKVYSTGLNNYGQLGIDSYDNSSAPTPIYVEGSRIKSLAVGNYNSMALDVSGNVWTWGSNIYGQIGNGSTAERYSLPQMLSSVSSANMIAGGGNHCLALSSGGTISAWGYNQYGQLGNGASGSVSRTPVTVQGLSDAKLVAAGVNHSLALRSDGTVSAWGLNNSGQLGDGSTTQRTTPVQVKNLSNISCVAGGDRHSAALRADGTVWAWGYNSFGQLGNGTTTSSLSPVQVMVSDSAPLTGIIDIAAGLNHCVAMGADGSVWAWGDNQFGQLGINSTSQTRSLYAMRTISEKANIITAGANSCAAGLKHTSVTAKLTITTSVPHGSTTPYQPGGYNAECGQSYVIYPVPFDNYKFSKWTAGGGLVIESAGGAPDNYYVQFHLNYAGSITANFVNNAIDDFNGDGMADVLFRKVSTGAVTGYAMNGAQALSKLAIDWGNFINYAQYNQVGKADFDGDGICDIVCRNPSSGNTVVCLMGQNGSWSTVRSCGTIYSGGDVGMRVAGCGRFFGGSKAGILWRNSGGDIILYKMDGASVSETRKIMTDPSALVVGVGDFNGDGACDFVTWNPSSAKTTVYLLDGFNILNSGVIYDSGNLNMRVAGCGDFNGDGYCDVMFRDESSGAITLYLMQGLNYTVQPLSGVGGQTGLRVADCGDYNGDGYCDFLMQDTSTGVVNVYLLGVDSAGTCLLAGTGDKLTGDDASPDYIVSGDHDSYNSLLTVTASGTGSGTTSPAVGVVTVQTGIPMTLTATPNVDSAFTGWTVSGGTLSDPLAAATVFTANMPACAVTAVFSKFNYGTDFNADNKADILWLNTWNGDIGLWLMNGYSTLQAGYVWLGGQDWVPAGKGDFNGDGYCDLVWRQRSTGANFVWLMREFQWISGAYIYNGSDPNWMVVGTGDFDGDGKCDILWQNSATKQAVIYLMNGASIKAWGVIYAGGVWTVSGTGDFNADGKCDIVWQNSATAQAAVWLMDGCTVLGSNNIYDGADPNWKIMTTGDFNGDGKFDIVWQYAPTGSAIIYMMDGLAVSAWGNIYQGGDPNWIVMDSGDYFGTKKWDIVWRHSPEGQTIMYKMNGTSLEGWCVIFNGDPNWTIIK